MTREEAIKTLRELWRETNDSWYQEVYDMAIEALQTIDNCDQCEWCCPSDGIPTIHVVRCKDCKHQEECEQIVVFDIHVDSVQGHRVDSCSYGERREP